MLDFYRKHYMTNNKIINSLDIVLAVFVTYLVIRSYNEGLFKLQLLLIFILWLRAVLTFLCMVKYRNANKMK